MQTKLHIFKWQVNKWLASIILIINNYLLFRVWLIIRLLNDFFIELLMAKKTSIPNERHFPTAKQDAVSSVAYDYGTPQSHSPSYRLAYDDYDFIMRDELRPVRLQLELLKPELIQLEENIKSTVVIFGSARIFDKETVTKTAEKTKRKFG